MKTVTVIMLKDSRTTSGFFSKNKTYRMPQEQAKGLIDAGKAKLVDRVVISRRSAEVNTGMVESKEKR